MPWLKLGPALGGLQGQAGSVGAQLLSAAGDVTTRNVAVTAIRKAREVFDGVLRRIQKNPRLEAPQKSTGLSGVKLEHAHITSTGKNSILFRSNWLKYFQQAQSQTLGKELQKSAMRNIESGSAALFGRAVGMGQRRVPLYALLGFSLGAGSVKTSNSSDEDFTCNIVCGHIKNLFQPSKYPGECMSPVHSGSSVEDFEFGQLIAKGCNAAVYEARLKKDSENWTLQECNEDSIVVIPEETASETESLSTCESFHHVDWLRDAKDDSFSDESDITIITDSQDSAGCYSMESTKISGDFDLAVKMMFNYDTESQAMAILRSMENESVPARMAEGFNQMTQWENGHHPKKKRLKPHPNIVDMKGIFVDEVQPLSNCLKEFPHALPTRINPDGFGRNKTMYLVMKRYNCTLRDYLHQFQPTTKEAVLLLTQLVEALVHIGEADIAHRDIKSDNILLDTDHEVPQLVLTDFGSCLADYHCDLKVPYFTDETCKGGNRSLMAPEVVCASPGYKVYLDYSKSDIWACGAVAYEIFGDDNPFYRSEKRQRLDSSNYKDEDLPDLPDEVPHTIRALLKAMLRRDPSKRPSAKVVANVLHLMLWGPAEWNSPAAFEQHPTCKVDALRWLLTMSAGTMCQRAMQRSSFIAAPNPVELHLKSVFLSRLDFHDIKSAQEMLWTLSQSK